MPERREGEPLDEAAYESGWEKGVQNANADIANGREQAEDTEEPQTDEEFGRSDGYSTTFWNWLRNQS